MKKSTSNTRRNHQGDTDELSCDFDSDLCGWKNDKMGDFSWVRMMGETPSKGTGPPWDHTTRSEITRMRFHHFWVSCEIAIAHAVCSVIVFHGAPGFQTNFCLVVFRSPLSGADETGVCTLRCFSIILLSQKRWSFLSLFTSKICSQVFRLHGASGSQSSKNRWLHLWAPALAVTGYLAKGILKVINLTDLDKFSLLLQLLKKTSVKGC